MLLDSYTGTLHITEKTRLVNLQIQSHRASHLKEGFFLLVFHSSQWNEMSHFFLLFSKSKGHLGEGHTSLLYVSWASNKMQMPEQRVATQQHFQNVILALGTCRHHVFEQIHSLPVVSFSKQGNVFPCCNWDFYEGM